jgi:hypothetical protein
VQSEAEIIQRVEQIMRRKNVVDATFDILQNSKEDQKKTNSRIKSIGTKKCQEIMRYSQNYTEQPIELSSSSQMNVISKKELPLSIQDISKAEMRVAAKKACYQKKKKKD